PVITGIGHDKDQSITDMVAHTSVKTPTAAAEFCISLGEQLVFRIQDLQEQLVDASNILCDDYRNHLQNKVMRLNYVYSLQTNRAQTDLQYVSTRILSAVSQLVYKQQNKLQFAELKISKSTQHYLIEQKQKLTHALFQVSIGTKHQLHSQKQQLQVLQSQVDMRNPLLLLSKGYTITTNSSGKIIQSIHDVSLHETVLTHVSDGIIESKRVK
ncbi:MAG TPA: exodeoxyribonuclease VII large subunit, partial [Bacteroidales bacterium]|nr:exodeoxyribonuclease VII large subunit [Bacteroidales bacterium]